MSTITQLEQGDKLQLVVSISEKTVAAVLLVEKKGQQIPIYFISHVLVGEEHWYELVEKMAYIVLIALFLTTFT